MKDKLNQFVANLNGQFVEVSYTPAIYQCMDLAYNWVFCLDIPKSTVQHQYAYEVYTLASDFTRQYFDIIPNLKETIPQEGDIVVFNKTSGNVAGHIAVVIEATQTKMKIFEQNRPLGTNAHIADISYTNCLGFLRPKFIEPCGQPEWFENLLLERNLSLDREGEFRAFWEKGVKYDDEVNSLKNQLISTNEALAQRATEVSALTEANQKLSDRNNELQEEANRLRGERDKASWEATQLGIKVEALEEEVAKLNRQIEAFKEKNDLYAYSWTERFLSLWRR